ncbi:MAG: excinuclease ABC subunit UvrA [Thermoflavifilum sp.]|uniref:excinuclease ABC subunit UvrA n=1 Tax=Thermoflavifilum sp. TaxID=1968839 RepID=UPI0018A467B0|nr:excinuclease ABC subunit UvrA [Thermoflavifilum sp.]QOR74946.1 MAG: excinuclease ABC subunit UvrA [Thermoflavifilum sp.]
MNRKTSEPASQTQSSVARTSSPTPEEGIAIVGARVHNLKNISVTIPKNKLVVITGVSGSGKSSLAFDTLYAEGQRRYLESFGAYARQFIGELERPDVDQITGLSPVISIEQKTTGRSPRSTVGTVTEVYDFMRLLFARIGEAYSYHTGKKMIRFSEEEIIRHLFKKFLHQRLTLLAPLVRGRKGHYRELFEQLRKQGYLKVRVDGEIRELVPKMQVDRYKIHDIELVVDRIQVEKDQQTRITQSVQKALEAGKGLIYVLEQQNQHLHVFSKHLMCADTGISYEEPSPNTFSFNSPYGACPRCKGLGAIYQIDMEAIIPDPEKSIEEGGLAPLGEMKDNFIFKQIQQLARKHGFSLRTPIKNLPKKILNLLLYGSEEEKVTVDLGFEEDFYQPYETGFEGVANQVMRYFYESPSDMVRSWAEGFMKLATCPECGGTRLKKESLWFKIHHKNIAELSAMDLRKLQAWFDELPRHLNERQLKIAHDVLKEIHDRLHFLLEVGLDYLTLDRPSKTLSGGESQRIRLATQIGSQLMGITYILDEPSIGLHQRDNHRLIRSLQSLCQMGNTVIVVEHDRDIMLESDYIIDIGPGAGIHGGEIVGQGTPDAFKQLPTLTAAYLRGEQKIAVPTQRREGNGRYLKLYGASGNNLKKINVNFPLGTFICITGVSGSGKSTLINETLFPILHAYCYGSRLQPLPYQKIEGLEHIDKVIEIDQSPIGRTPRSNPATYCGFFTDIRQLFAQLPESRIRGYNAGRFSFNVKAGRCPTCEGAGWRTIEMNFLPDVYVPCEQCHGRRYNRETLEIRYKGKSIADVLEMTVDEAVSFFESIPYLYRKIKVLQEVGLGYITLGQSAVTLSGGEAQRVKLATELSKKDTGRTFYILDEPTTGLHFQDIQHLLDVLQKLVDRGNTVLVIEHNMDVIKVADYIIDLGPEGGEGGGYIVCTGTPEAIARHPQSYTGAYLKHELS